MRATRLVSDSCTWLGARRPRLRLVAFLVRMCDLKACPALNLPDAVLRNRLAAARLVLIFGMLPLRFGFRDWPGRRSLDRAFHPCPCRTTVSGCRFDRPPIRGGWVALQIAKRWFSPSPP